MTGGGQQMERVNVTDSEWRAFRRLCIDDRVSVAEAVARLVRDELARRSRTTRRRKRADLSGATLFDA